MENQMDVTEKAFDAEYLGNIIHGTITTLGKAPEGWSNPDIVRLSFNDSCLIGYRKPTSVLGQKVETL